MCPSREGGRTRGKTRALSFTNPDDLTSVMAQVLADGAKARDSFAQESIAAVLATLSMKSLGRHRGMLAPSRQVAHTEPAHTEPAHTEPAHTVPAHTEPAHTEPESSSKEEEAVSQRPEPEAVTGPRPSEESLQLMGEATRAIASLAEASRVSMIQRLAATTGPSGAGGIEGKAQAGAAGQKQAVPVAATATPAVAASGEKRDTQVQSIGQTFISMFTGRGASSEAQQTGAAGAGSAGGPQSTEQLEIVEAMVATARGKESTGLGAGEGTEEHEGRRRGRRSGRRRGRRSGRRRRGGRGGSPHWVPQEGKYLLLWCVFGRMSNQMACLRRDPAPGCPSEPHPPGAPLLHPHVPRQRS